MTGPSKRTVLWRVLKALWLLACVWILVLTLVYRGPKYRDAVEGELLIMMGLSFPAGWLFAYLFLGTLLGGSQTSELQWIFLIWLPLLVLGYLQWFLLVPVLVRWGSKKFRRNASGNATFVARD